MDGLTTLQEPNKGKLVFVKGFTSFDIPFTMLGSRDTINTGLFLYYGCRTVSL